jgi:hypothetical protein
MRFQRRGGRKRIVAPDGCELVAATKPQPDATEGARAGVALVGLREQQSRNSLPARSNRIGAPVW